MSHIQPSLTFIFLRWDRSNEFAGPSISNEHRNNAENKCKDDNISTRPGTYVVLHFLTVDIAIVTSYP